MKKTIEKKKSLFLQTFSQKILICVMCTLLFIVPTYVFGQEQITVTGVVTETTGEPLPGVNVVIKGTTQGAVSDTDGKYSIDVNSDAVLAFSFIGFENLEVNVADRNTINVTLVQSMVGLDEVVAIGYGTQSRRTITTAVSKLGSEKLENVPISSVSTALQGKIAGVRIYQSGGGQPGSDASVRIRGGSSINKSNAPLVIVDGMIRDMDDINPKDIESVQVLKDASSTAIYGARASNGVLLITTKKGKHGKAEINFDMNLGMASPWKYMDMIGATDFIRLTREALLRSPSAKKLTQQHPSGIGNSLSSPWSLRILENGDPVPEGYLSMPDPIDPSKTLIYQDNDFQRIGLDPALEQNYYLSVNGGSDNIKYAGGLGYTNNEGMAVGTKYERFTARTNVDFRLRDNLSLSTRMDHSSSKTNSYGSQRNVFNRSLWLAPTAKVYNEDGTYALGNNATYTNPLWYNEVNQRDIFEYRTNIGASLNWDIITGLQAKIKGDYFLYNRTFESFYVANAYNSSRPAVFTYDQAKRIQLEGILTYAKTFSDAHNLNVVAGISQLQAENFDARAEAQGGSTDKIQTLNAAPEKLDASTYRTEEALLGIFGRLTYDYQKKYLLGISLRRDGSSRFAEENRIGYFPGASIGWIATEEEFLSNNPTVNTLKLRGSWGQTGNNSVGLYTSAGVYQVGNNYNGMAGVLPSQMPNQGLGWETTTQWDIGFDLGLLENDKVKILFDYYEKITDDLLFATPLPNTTGFNSIEQNIGKVKFHGYEFEIWADILNKGDFSWNADFNLGYNMNKVLELPDNGIENNRIGGIYNPDGESFGGIAEGERMYSVIGHKADFIIDTWEQANDAKWDYKAKGWSPLDGKKVKGRKIPGDMEWIDRDDDGDIDTYDQFVLGYRVPTITGGFSNNFVFKNFKLDIFMDYALGHSIMDNTIRRGDANAIGGAATPTTNVFGAWKEEGDAASGKATMPRFDYHDAGQQANIHRDNDKAVFKGDYLCIREVRLNYTIPHSVISSLNLSSANIYVAGQNLYYFTAYPGWIPEYSGGGGNYSDNTYPIPRKVVVGIKIGF